MENLDLNLKYIRKTSRKIVKNKYLTYFVALFTIFFISESLINSDNITFVKLLFQNNTLKVLVFLLIVFIGYFNMTLGFLLLLNFIFIINVPQKVEGFANSFPNLIDKNELLKYQKNYVSTEPEKLKYKSNEEMSKKIKENNNSEGKDKNKDKKEKKKAEKEFTKNPKNDSITINNPINLKASEKLEKVKKIMKEKQEKNNTKTDSETDNDETTSLSLRKKKLREELQKLEKDEKEIKDLNDSDDDTIESDIKQKDLDKRLRLQAIKDEETDESSSSSSNSSGSSSSSESSEDSDKDYDEVSINDARDHVMNKLRNKLKRKYVKGK